MHFTTLGYSRPDGQTSDHWLDVGRLEWEPRFVQYVRDAFAPVGLMIDAWADEYPPGENREFPVVVINDLDRKWSGSGPVPPAQPAQGRTGSDQDLELSALGSKRLAFAITIPSEPGSYQLEATLVELRRCARTQPARLQCAQRLRAQAASWHRRGPAGHRVFQPGEGRRHHTRGGRGRPARDSLVVGVLGPAVAGRRPGGSGEGQSRRAALGSSVRAGLCDRGFAPTARNGPKSTRRTPAGAAPKPFVFTPWTCASSATQAVHGALSTATRSANSGCFRERPLGTTFQCGCAPSAL